MWPDSEQTRELIAGAGKGDADAVNDLLDRHRDSLRRMVELRLDRRVAQRVDASDVVQDVLLEANQRLADYVRDPKLPFHLWLRQLAKDRMIDMYRRHRGAQRRSVDREQRPAGAGPRSQAGAWEREQSSLDLLAQLRDSELTPAAASIRRELAERFLAALDELSEDERELILMRHYEHLSNSEVAQALEVTPATAGMRHLRALRKLRMILGESLSSDAEGSSP